MHSAKASYEEADYERVSRLPTGPRSSCAAAHGRHRLVAVIEALRGRALRRPGRAARRARSLLELPMEVLTDEPGLDTVQVAACLAAVCSLPSTATATR